MRFTADDEGGPDSIRPTTGRGHGRRCLRRFPAERALIRLGLIGSVFATSLSFGQTTPFLARPAPADRPFLSQFASDLQHNAVGLWASDNLTPLVLGGIGASGARLADHGIADYFGARQDRFSTMSTVGKWMGKSEIIGPAIGASLIVSRFTSNETFRGLSYDLAQGAVLSTTVTNAVKFGMERERPDGSNDLSFPSGHTSTTVMMATVIERRFGWKAAVPAYSAAAFVGASRITGNKHFLSDVVAGAALGFIVGRTVTRGDGEDRRFDWSVGVAPGGGAAVNLGIRLGALSR